MAEREGFKLFLASFEHMLHGGCDDYSGADINDEFDTHWKLQKMVHLDGSDVARNVDITPDNLIQPWDELNLAPDDQYFSGHTGNTGAEKILWYRKAVSVANTQ